MRAWLTLSFLVAICGIMPAGAEPPAHALTSRPAEVALTLPPGLTRLSDAWVYRPPGATGRLPLLVLLIEADIYDEGIGYALQLPQR